LDEPDFRGLFEAAPTPLLVVAPPHWIIVAANDARLRVTGTTRAGQVGRRLFDLFPDDPADPAADGVRNLSASFERVLATKAPDTMAVQRYPVRNVAGRFEERWWTPINTPMLGPDGEVALIIHKVEDVTDIVRLRGEAHARDQLAREQQDVITRLRATEAELRRSEEFNRRILASSADCIKVLDLEARLEFMSEGGMCVMEIEDFGAIRGACWPDFWTGEGHEKAVAAVATAQSGGTGRFQGFATTMKGSPRWWDVIVTPIDGPDGKPVKLLSVSRDVTATKLVEEALRVSEGRLRDLNATLERKVAERTAERDRVWQISRDLIAVVGSNGILHAANPAWRAVLGHDPDDVVGRPVRDFAWPGDPVRTHDRTDGGEIRDVLNSEVRYAHRDGTPRWISWVASVEDGLVYAYGRDVTAEKAREAELEAAQDALRQSQKLEAVGQLTGGVAHDFNNLLTVIKSSTDLLKRPDLPEERRQRYIGAISDTVARAAKLTGQLLAFARRQALKPEVFDAGRSILTISDMVGTLSGSRIKIVTDIPDEPCFINADPSQFDTALVNMAVNARDAMDGEGTLTITIHSVSVIPPIRSHSAVRGDFVAVCIEDTGAGIASDQIEHIFEPFFTTKGVGQGTGLGLSQVFGFAKQSGGEVRVQSTVGQGTVFVLYLPRVEAAVHVAQAEPEPLVDGHGTCVLVVEDNPDVGTFATQTLAELGYVTVWAANAEEALVELAKGADRFDVVFTDVVMPGMNGIDLAHQIRQDYHDLPVLLASGYSHVLAQNGTYGFELLHKPYSVEQLSRLLRKVATWQQSKRVIGQ
jgi:PAS domain S-box-containing protein